MLFEATRVLQHHREFPVFELPAAFQFLEIEIA
jgi:hypothetical protein